MQKTSSFKSRARKQRSLMAAAGDLIQWQRFRMTLPKSCGDAGTCADARCRRRKHCYKRQWIDAEVAASRQRLHAALADAS